MKHYIKFMVSLRCKMVVRDELNRLSIPYNTVDLGEVDITDNLTEIKREQLKSALLKSGLELMEDKKSMLIERIKNVIIEMIHQTDEIPKINFSVYLTEQLDYDYTYLSNLCSETEGITIEQLMIQHKIERVKELILYDELNLTEIAAKLQYSSVAALSNQFKKVTGLTPSFFKSLKSKRRRSLEKV